MGSIIRLEGKGCLCLAKVTVSNLHIKKKSFFLFVWCAERFCSFFVLFFLLYATYTRRRLLAAVLAAAEARVGGSTAARARAAEKSDGSLHSLWLGQNLQQLVAHAILARAQVRLLALGDAAGLALDDGEQALQLVLGDAERVVADAEGLLVGHESVPRVVVLVQKLPLDGGEEVGAELQRQAHGQVRVAEDAVHLHVGVDPVRLVVLSVAIDGGALYAELGLPPLVGDGLPALGLCLCVLPELVTAHDRLARAQSAQGLGVVDGVPAEERDRERRVLALAELLQNGALALVQYLGKLGLQDVCVGRHDGTVLLALLVLEDLHELAAPWVGEVRQNRGRLERLEESGVLGGQGEGEVERSHGCWSEGTGEVCWLCAAAGVQIYTHNKVLKAL